MKHLRSTLIGLTLLAASAMLMPNPSATAHAQIDLNPTGIDLPQEKEGETAKEKVGNLIVSIINLMLSFAALLAVGAIIWGGIIYITSVGNESQVGKAKKIIFWAIVGLLITGLSFLIVRFVGQALGVVAAPKK